LDISVVADLRRGQNQAWVFVCLGASAYLTKFHVRETTEIYLPVVAVAAQELVKIKNMARGGFQYTIAGDRLA
jgi:hypothetical protein